MRAPCTHTPDPPIDPGMRCARCVLEDEGGWIGLKGCLDVMQIVRRRIACASGSDADVMLALVERQLRYGAEDQRRIAETLYE